MHHVMLSKENRFLQQVTELKAQCVFFLFFAPVSFFFQIAFSLFIVTLYIFGLDILFVFAYLFQ